MHEGKKSGLNQFPLIFDVILSGLENTNNNHKNNVALSSRSNARLTLLLLK